MISNQTYFIVINALFLFFDPITILFSLTVLIIIIRHWHTECRSIANFLTCNSCIALLFYVFSISFQHPLIILIIHFELTDINPIYCKFCACLATCGTVMLSNSYLIQAISRFFITILYKHRVLLTFRTNWIMIITGWTTSGITAIGMFISPSAYQYEPESHLCTLTTKNLLTSLMPSVINGILTMNIIMILYGIILYHTAHHTRVNPNGSSTLHAERNMKVFQNIFLSISILGLGGAPYVICSIINRIGQAPWPLYSLALLCTAFASTINSIVLLVTNDQVKKILLGKLTGRQANVVNRRLKHRKNQVVPFSTQTKTAGVLKTIS